jgi:hypothetical protein
MTIKANKIQGGETIKVGRKTIEVMEVSVNFGCFGDFVSIWGIDTRTGNYIDRFKVDIDAKFELV